MAKKARKKVKKAKKITVKRKKKAPKRIAKKTAKKRVSAKKKAPKPPKSPTAGLEVIGEITHYFPHVNAGVIKLKKPLSVGDQIYIKGHTTDFKEKVDSMQIDHVPVQSAKPQDEIGILVKQRVRAGDTVYRI